MYSAFGVDGIFLRLTNDDSSDFLGRQSAEVRVLRKGVGVASIRGLA